MSANMPEAHKANKPHHREEACKAFWCPLLEPSHAGHPKVLLQLPLQAVKEVLFVTKCDPVCPFFLSSKSIIISPKGTFCVGRRKENRVKKETMVPFTENSCKPEEGEIWG